VIPSLHSRFLILTRLYQGLHPGLFWSNYTQLLSASREDLPRLIEEVVRSETTESTTPFSAPSSISQVGNRLKIARLGTAIPFLDSAQNLAFVLLMPASSTIILENSNVLQIREVSGKKGQAHFLQVVLPTALPFIHEQLVHGRNICIACESGKDQSVGVTLAALQLFFGDDGSFVQTDESSNITTGQHILQYSISF